MLFLMVNRLHGLAYSRNRISGARVDRFHDLQHSHPGACCHKLPALPAERFNHVRAIEARGVAKSRFVRRGAIEGHVKAHLEERQ
jgi:hypothetical protein